MNIGILYQDSYPRNNEVITSRLSTALKANDHSVVIFSPYSNALAVEESLEKIIPMVTQKSSSLSNWSKIKSLTYPFNFWWVIWLYRQLQNQAIDLLIVRDLRLALPALLAAKLLKVRVILSLCENYAAMVEWFGREKAEHWIIRQPKLVEILEFGCARQADHVWVVIEENRERLIQAGVRADKVSVLHNVPEFNRNAQAITLGSGNSCGDLTLAFVGVVSKIRCLDRVIEGLAKLSGQDLSRIKLMVFGDGEDLPRLQEIAHKLNLEEHIKFYRWTKLEDVRQHLNGVGRCVGLIPHYINELTDNTIPNKLFDYMAMGLPVLVTDAKPMRRFVESLGCGWVAGDTSLAFSEVFQQLLHTPITDFEEAGKKGYKAIVKRYNWNYYIPIVNADVNRIVKEEKR